MKHMHIMYKTQHSRFIMAAIMADDATLSVYAQARRRVGACAR